MNKEKYYGQLPRHGVIAGNFDVIHPGYIKMFKDCKRECKNLTILLHTDPTIERPDTKLKPVLSVDDRMEMLLHFNSINSVVPYDTENDLVRLLEDLQPDVRFLGDDYKDAEYFTGDHLDIPIVYLDRSHGWSTTKFKRAIHDSVDKMAKQTIRNAYGGY